MSQRMFTMATVHFQARSPAAQHDAITLNAMNSGVPHHLVVTCLREHLLHAARMGAAAQLREMEQWTAERWRAECGVRIASAPEGTTDGRD